MSSCPTRQSVTVSVKRSLVLRGDSPATPTVNAAREGGGVPSVGPKTSLLRNVQSKVHTYRSNELKKTSWEPPYIRSPRIYGFSNQHFHCSATETFHLPLSLLFFFYLFIFIFENNLIISFWWRPEREGYTFFKWQLASRAGTRRITLLFLISFRSLLFLWSAFFAVLEICSVFRPRRALSATAFAYESGAPLTSQQQVSSQSTISE